VIFKAIIVPAQVEKVGFAKCFFVSNCVRFDTDNSRSFFVEIGQRIAWQFMFET